jgi:aspartyl/asparaginyl beta-hydroxylase (cupin superfamily)
MHGVVNYILIFTILIVILFLIIYGKSIKNDFGANRRFYDDPFEVFPQLKILVDNYEIIEKEYLADTGYKQYDWPEKDLYTKEKGHDWKVVPLYGFGIWNKQYAKKFSQTIKLLKDIRGLRTAIFSKLGPRTKLNKHQGWASLANEVLRCHMGIVVPKGRSGVEVEDEFRQIKKGEWIVFDDSKIHIGVNNTNNDRVVLLLDIERPQWVKKGKSRVNNTPELKSFLAQFTK